MALKSNSPLKRQAYKKTLPHALEKNPTKKFNINDFFIFHTTNIGVEFSLLISIGGLPGKLIFIPTTSKVKLEFNHYIFLDIYATIDEITAKINNNEYNNLKCNMISEILTEREKTVMYHTINGMSAHSISQSLSISIKTVYAHRHNALHKLGGRNLFDIWPFMGRFLQATVILS